MGKLREREGAEKEMLNFIEGGELDKVFNLDEEQDGGEGGALSEVAISKWERV